MRARAMSSPDASIAERIASRGLKAIEKVLIELDGLPRDDWSRTHVKDITDCVNAAVKVLAEEREWEAFERESEAAARKVSVPAGVRIDNRPMIDVMTDIYRFRLVAGDVTTTELGRMTDQFLSIDHAKVALILKLLGPNVAGKTSEEIEALKEGRILPRQEPTPPANVVPAQAGEAERASPLTAAEPASDTSPSPTSPFPSSPNPTGTLSGGLEGGLEGSVDAVVPCGGFRVADDDDDDEGDS
jgi:hypothetical protein